MHTLKTRTALAILIATVICGPSAAAGKGKAFSLNATAAALKTGPSAQAQSLFGITRVLGYTVDTASRDVIVFGKVDPDLPALHLDDLAVAVRNAWMVYATTEGNIRYYSYPGCSIDPDPNVLRELAEIESEGIDFSDPAAVDAFRERWKGVGSRPQKVRVMGVPFDSRFAKVMVDADFYMKRLVNGSVQLGIEGFESLNDIRNRAYRERTVAGEAPPMSLNRFWFNPGNATYEEKNGMVLLRECSVVLLTEEEFLSRQGSIQGKGRPDPYAGRFARSFSEKYPAIAEARPVYAELEALYRFAAIAQLLKADRADRTASPGFAYLLRTHKPAVVPVSRAVKGLADVVYTEETVETAEGQVLLQSLQSFCGGVSMEVKPRRIVSAPAPSKTVARPDSGAMSGKTAAVAKPRTGKNTVISARKSPKQISWEVPLEDLE